MIAHNNKGLAPGWFLDRILIEDINAHHIYEFLCNRWLAKDEDDKQIVRELIPTQDLPDTIYHVKIKTGDVFEAGTDADVHLQIFGENGNTDKIQLTTFNNSINTFQRGSIDTFTFQSHDLGKVCYFLFLLPPF